MLSGTTLRNVPRSFVFSFLPSKSVRHTLVSDVGGNGLLWTIKRQRNLPYFVLTRNFFPFCALSITQLSPFGRNDFQLFLLIARRIEHDFFFHRVCVTHKSGTRWLGWFQWLLFGSACANHLIWSRIFVARNYDLIKECERKSEKETLTEGLDSR